MPGLFSRYGALGNPLVDLVGTATLGAAIQRGQMEAQQRAMQPDLQSLAFANAAYGQGRLVDSAPRAPGLFSNIGVKLGILSPNVTPRQKDLSEEYRALEDRRKQQQETISKEVSWAKDVGWKNFQNMQDLPAVKQMTMFATGGKPTIGIEGPLVREEAIAAVNAQREFMRNAETQRLALANREQDLRDAQWARKQKEPLPFSPEWMKGEAERAAVVRTATETAMTNLEKNDWFTWHRHFLNQSFVDQDFNPVDESKVTPGQAMADHVHYRRLLNAAQQGDAQSTHALIDNLTHLRNVILPNILVDTTGMSNATADAAKIANWGEKSTIGHFSADMSSFKSVGADAMAFAKDVQHRYGTTRELDYIVQGNMPFLRTDSLADGQKKIDLMIRNLRIAGGYAVDEGGLKASTSTAVSDYYKDIGPSPVPSTGTEISPGSVVPPMPGEPAGMSSLGGIIGGSDETPEGAMGGTP